MGLFEMLMRVHDQRDTPGGDRAIRQPLDWRRMWSGDPGIYGQGNKPWPVNQRLGGNPVEPPMVGFPSDRQPRITGNVLRSLQGGLDVDLTGSGLELSPDELINRNRSAFDMLQRYLQGQRPTSIENWVMENWR